MKRVVIIGGGFAGTLIAKKLQSHFAVTLIDSKNYFEFTPGILRTIVEPAHWKHIRVLHRQYLKRTKLVLGIVSSVAEHDVRIGKHHLPFDYLVICSGSSYNSPIKEQHVVLPVRARHLIDAHRRLEKAARVLIIGGGLVGVELAAEIITHYPNKAVSIVHPYQFLIERNHLKSRIYAAAFLKKRGVDIIYCDRVKRNEHGAFVTEQGRTLHADITFLCTGITPNFSFLDGTFKHVLNERNQVRINQHLQVKDFEHIFAAGDITDSVVEKTAQNAEKQAAVVAANIRALERGEVLRSYAPRRTSQVISLGKWDGIFEVGEHIITGLVPAYMKSAIERREMWRRGCLFR